MSTSPELQLAERVAAWHNRHPLARRIVPAQVHGPGVVALPFAVSGRRRRLLTAEQLLPELAPSRLARLALRHGGPAHPGPAHWPLRELLPDPPVAPTVTREWRHLLTAAIEVGDRRHRVFVGPGPKAPVLGQRLWDRRRVGLAGLAGVVLAAGAVLAGRGTDPVVLASAPATAAVASAAAAAAPTTAARTAPLAASGPVSSPDPAGRPDGAGAMAAPSVAAASTPGTAAASGAEGPSRHPPGSADALPPRSADVASASPATAAAPGEREERATASGDIRPLLDAEARAQALAEGRRLRSLGPAAAAAGASAASTAAPTRPEDAGKVFAVAAMTTRNRSTSQLRIVLMNAPTEAEPGQPRAEVMPVAGGFRAVIWPYDSRAAAERVRELLAARGIPTEVIAF